MDQSVDRGEAPRRRTSDGLAAVAIILLTLVLIVVVVSALVEPAASDPALGPIAGPEPIGR